MGENQPRQNNNGCDVTHACNTRLPFSGPLPDCFSAFDRTVVKRYVINYGRIYMTVAFYEFPNRNSNSGRGCHRNSTTRGLIVWGFSQSFSRRVSLLSGKIGITRMRLIPLRCTTLCLIPLNLYSLVRFRTLMYFLTVSVKPIVYYSLICKHICLLSSW